MRAPERRVLHWDPYLESDEGDLEFRLTYAGDLLAHRDGKRLPERSLHVHKLRKEFHKQLRTLWAEHPVMRQISKEGSSVSLYVGSDDAPPLNQVFARDGFNWLPMVTEENGLICKLDVLMLRHGQPGRVLHDVDNRLKTLFDALRKAKGPRELGAGTASGQVTPDPAAEDPFYVLLEDDKLITHLSVTTDALLEPLDPALGVPPENQVRLVVSVTVRPYRVFPENVGYA